jgi:hypothetical protein
MAINFPNTPSVNELYSFSGKTWQWNGIYWEVYSALTSYITSVYTVGDGISSISGVSGGNVALKSFSGFNITIADSGDKLTFSSNNYDAGVITNSTGWTNNGNGTMNLPQVQVALYDNPNYLGPVKVYTVASGVTGSGGISGITDNDTNYIYIEYNGGNPRWVVSTDNSAINDSDVVRFQTVYRIGNIIHNLEWGNQGAGLPNKITNRIDAVDRFARESGLSLGLSGATGVVTLSSGIAWNGTNRQSLAAINSQDDIFFQNFHSGGTWTFVTTGNTLNNVYYDDGTDRVVASAGTYLVNWYFRGQEINDHLYEVWGNDEYVSVSEAQLSTEPNLPELITSHAVLVGRIIVQVSATTGFVESAFVRTFQPTTVQEHNDLTGIQGGSAGQYYHLDSNQYNNLALTNTSNTFTSQQNFNVITATTINANTISGGTLYGDGSNLTNVDNIYTVDGSLSANRIVNLNGNNLSFSSSSVSGETKIYNNGKVLIGKEFTTINAPTNSSEYLLSIGNNGTNDWGQGLVIKPWTGSSQFLFGSTGTGLVPPAAATGNLIMTSYIDYSSYYDYPTGFRLDVIGKDIPSGTDAGMMNISFFSGASLGNAVSNRPLLTINNGPGIGIFNTPYLKIFETGSIVINKSTDSGQKLQIFASSDPVKFEGLQIQNSDTQVVTTDSNGVLHKRTYDYVTGFTYTPTANTFTITTTSGNSYSASINEMTGLTINGNLNVSGNYFVSGDTIVSGNTVFTGTTTFNTVPNAIGDFLTLPTSNVMSRRTSDQVRDDIGYYGLTFAIMNGYY